MEGRASSLAQRGISRPYTSWTLYLHGSTACDKLAVHAGRAISTHAAGIARQTACRARNKRGDRAIHQQKPVARLRCRQTRCGEGHVREPPDKCIKGLGAVAELLGKSIQTSPAA